MTRRPENYHQPDYQHVQALVVHLKRGRATHLESIIRFLEEDPYTDGSGYLKEKIWRYLRRVELTEEQKERLRRTALQYVAIRLSREFFYMCRFITGIATEGLKEQVRALEGSPDERVRHRASLLAAYLEGINQGEAARRASFWPWIMSRVRRLQQE
jgi:hypothetical protein